METKGTYQASEHCVFKRTFLVQTEVAANFPTLAPDIFIDRIIPFLKEVFELDVNHVPDKSTNHVELTSKEEQKQFIFDVNQARIIVGQKNYVSFDKTIFPMIGKLHRYVTDVAGTDMISLLKIIKVNRWPFGSEDAFSSYPNMLKFTFNEKNVSDMPSCPVSDNKEPFKVSRTKRIDASNDMRLEATLSCDVESKENAKLGLLLDAAVKDISIKDLYSKVIELNDLVYNNFIETISDNIIDLMSREK